MNTEKKLLQCANDYELNKTLVFQDYPEFKPDFTPIQMAWLGVFKGSYFNSKLHGLEKQFENNLESICHLVDMTFFTDINHSKLDIYFSHFQSKLFANKSEININLFKVDCGSDYYQWLSKGWIFNIDPFGWWNWYINFYYGRRHSCDKTQIKRWSSFKARHSGMLLARCKPDEINKCLKTRQNLLHWAIDSTRL